MPGQAEVACAALNRADDLVGDMLVDVEALAGLHEPALAARGRPRIPAKAGGD